MAQYGSPGGISIPAIQQAYQNDPRTLLANNAFKQGMSTAPVAGGKFAFADAVARALQGVAGGLIERGTQKKYKAQQDQYQHDLAAALDAGMQPPAPPAAVADGPPSAPGAPPGVAPPQAPPGPGAPPSPAPQPQPSQQAPGNAPAIAAAMGAPGAPPVMPGQPPQAPFAGVQLPQMPTAPSTDTGPVSSRHSAIAKALLASGNPYLTQMAQEQAMSGIDDEQRQAEAAGQRKFDLAKTGYGAQLDDYNSAHSAARTAQYARANSDADFKNELAKGEKEHGYRLSENAQNNAAAMTREGMSNRTAIQVAMLNENGAMARTRMTIEASKASAQDKIDAKRNAFVQSPQGSKVWQATGDAIQKNNDFLAGVQAFKQLNATTPTGGISAAPGLSTLRGQFGGNFANMRAITQKMVPSIRAPGDIMSDKDKVLYEQSVPSIHNTKAANDAIADRLANVVNRDNEFQQSKFDALAQGNTNFFREWAAYKNSVPIDKNIPFPQWKASLRQVK